MIKGLKSDFPILSSDINGQTITYLDNAATTQKPQAVIDRLVDYYSHENANVYRGVHTLAERSTAEYMAARRKVKDFIKADREEEIIFTTGTTQSLNMVAPAFAGKILEPGDEVLVSEMEHHANLIPWQEVARKTGAVLKHIPLTEDFRLDMKAAEDLITEKTKILAITQVSNVLGTINPVKELGEMVHAKGGYLIVDGAQAVPHMPVDVQDLDADFYAFSGHKMLGPTGIGVLYGKADLLDIMDPLEFGGEMITTVSLDQAEYAQAPMKFEAGTPNIAGAIGLGTAIDYLEKIGMAEVQAYEEELAAYVLPKLLEVDGVNLIGPPDLSDRAAVFSFKVDGVHPHDLATALDLEGVAVRAGHHCAEPLHKSLGVQSSSRASFYIYNTTEDADRFFQALTQAQTFFKR